MQKRRTEGRKSRRKYNRKGIPTEENGIPAVECVTELDKERSVGGGIISWKKAVVQNFCRLIAEISEESSFAKKCSPQGSRQEGKG